MGWPKERGISRSKADFSGKYQLKIWAQNSGKSEIRQLITDITDLRGYLFHSIAEFFKIRDGEALKWKYSKELTLGLAAWCNYSQSKFVGATDLISEAIEM